MLDNLLKSIETTNKVDIFGIKIDLNFINEIISKIIIIVIVAILAFFIVKIGNKLIDKIIKKQIERNGMFTLTEGKANTIGTLLKSILKYSVYFLAIILIIGFIIGGTVPIAFASVGGVAFGLGAQSFVKDLINGVFILFENQYNVGDYITVDKYTGIVESIEIRSTTLREFSGSYHIIPNGLINVVTNHSKGDMQIKVEVQIAYNESIDKAIEVIEKACDKFYEVNAAATSKPKVVGVTSLGTSGMTIRVIGDAMAMSQWKAEAELRQIIKEYLDDAGIEIPYNKLVLVNDTEKIKVDNKDINNLLNNQEEAIVDDR
ncbi:MAG: mechanosensitive ion channel family protein [Sarcina sp.]